MAIAATYEQRLRSSFDAVLGEASDFFMGRGDLRGTVRRLAASLGAEGISYAIVGSLAAGEHGYVRMTEDVDVLLTAEGLARFEERLVGRGFVRTHPGSRRSFRDAQTGVRVEVLVAGEFPGDGKPKAIAFPDPSGTTIEVDGLLVLALPRLIELKLASGMSAPHRLRDLADVQELIRERQLDEAFATALDPSVREKFLELLAASRSG
jgi:hypothetical protein